MVPNTWAPTSYRLQTAQFGIMSSLDSREIMLAALCLCADALCLCADPLCLCADALCHALCISGGASLRAALSFYLFYIISLFCCVECSSNLTKDNGATSSLPCLVHVHVNTLRLQFFIHDDGICKSALYVVCHCSVQVSSLFNVLFVYHARLSAS